jgi:hypothetical protein
MNGTAFWSSQLFPPRHHGSGAAPLADLLVAGHDGRVPGLTRSQRDLMMAWMDTNGLYYGTWDYTKHGYTNRHWNNTKKSLLTEMQKAGCMKCHTDGKRVLYFENDWINLEKPQFSRILRAPLTKGAKGFGLGLCRQRKADARRQRLRLLRNGYAHAVQPLDRFARQPFVPASMEGVPAVSFSSIDNPQYQRMLTIIRDARKQTLDSPRVDMPGADVIAGESRASFP